MTRNHGLNFWYRPQHWPTDSSEHVFLARAVHRVGRGIYGEEWTGTEPTTPVAEPVPIIVPKGDHRTALAVYRMLHAERPDLNLTDPEELPWRRHGMARGAQIREAPELTDEQWSAAREIYKRRQAELAPAHARFRAVCREITRQCSSGSVKSSVRSRMGGQFHLLPSHVWNTDGKPLELRFECLLLDPGKPFSIGVSSKAQWLFLERESLDRVLASLQPPELPSGAPTSEAPVLDRRLPSKAILEFLSTRADGNTPLPALRSAAKAHFESQGKSFTEVRWREALKELPESQKLRVGQQPKSDVSSDA